MDIINNLKSMEEVCWMNPGYRKFDDIKDQLPITEDEVWEVEERMRKFAPYLIKAFPDSEDGIIESQISDIPNMKNWIERKSGQAVPGELYLKRDDTLPIGGSIKARGGVYEVLKHAEDLAEKNGLLDTDDDFKKFGDKRFVEFYNDYTIEVGSTGNLGLTVGIIGAKLGFKVIVHMTSDSKQWKKDMLRVNGATVIEYSEEYSKAVEEGRKNSQADPNSYFIDDEKSKDLFLVYAVAGKRIKSQLEEKDIIIDERNPLVVYLPCGVGVAPGGVAYGLKLAYGDLVHCYFAEPTHSPSMLLGLATGKHNKISVEEIGLDNITEADGLAVGRPSAFVGEIVEKLLSGIITIEDEKMYTYLQGLHKNENIFIEPSATVGFNGLLLTKEKYIDKNPVQLVWGTGGSILPPSERSRLLKRKQDFGVKLF